MIDSGKQQPQDETPVNNYEEFKNRLLNAAKDLKKRKNIVSKQAFLLDSMVHQNQTAYDNWTVKHAETLSIHTAYDGGPEGYRIISDLLDTANRMLNVFGKRIKILEEKLAAAASNYEAIHNSITELESSLSKLDLSKMLSDNKAKLSATENSLGGAGLYGQPSSGTLLSQELKAAREAVVMAEALLEVKGH